MIEVTHLKVGKTFEADGIPFIVTKYEHQKIARGSGTVKLTLRNLKNGELSKKTYSPNHRFEEISTQKSPLQYLFNDGVVATFMDQNTFEQVEVSTEVLENELSYIKEGEIVDVLFWDGKPLSVSIAPKVTLEVKQTTPGVKGNSATNVFKPAKLENGLEIKVPLFIKVGDKIRVDTRNGEYIERVN